MKILFSIAVAMAFCNATCCQNIGIGTTTPNASALLDITSTAKGMLIPRMTTAQRTAIASPAKGLMVFDTDVNSFWFHNGTGWIQMAIGGATNYWSLNGTNIFSNNAGYVGIGTSTPNYKLSIFNNVVESNNNSSLLKISGRNPVMVLTDELDNGYGYLKAWTNGANGGFGNGMLIGAFPGYPIYFSTNYGPTMTLAANNLLGIGTTTPNSPLSFGNIIGNKVSLWSSGPNNDFGIGLNLGEMQLYTAGQDHISFGYGNSNAFNETMRYYTGSGQLCLGTTTPQAKLHIAKDQEALRLTGSQSYLSFFNGTTNAAYVGYLWNKGGWDMELGTSGVNAAGSIYLSIKGTPALTIWNDGRAGIAGNPGLIQVNGNYSALPAFTVNGFFTVKQVGGPTDEWTLESGQGFNNLGRLDFYKNGGDKAYINGNDGSWNQLSDASLKDNVQTYKPVIDDLQKLNVCTYHYKINEPGQRSFGLIAQNVAAYFPEIVSEGKDRWGKKLLGMDYSKTGVLAIKAIQEQQIIIQAQQKQIDDLTARLAAIEKMLLNK